MTPLDTSHKSNLGTKLLLSIRLEPSSLFCDVQRAPLRRPRACDVARRCVQLSPVGTRSPRCSWSAAWERVSSRRSPQATRCQIPRLPGQPELWARAKARLCPAAPRKERVGPGRAGDRFPPLGAGAPRPSPHRRSRRSDPCGRASGRSGAQGRASLQSPTRGPPRCGVVAGGDTGFGDGNRAPGHQLRQPRKCDPCGGQLGCRPPGELEGRWAERRGLEPRTREPSGGRDRGHLSAQVFYSTGGEFQGQRVTRRGSWAAGPGGRGTGGGP